MCSMNKVLHVNLADPRMLYAHASSTSTKVSPLESSMSNTATHIKSWDVCMRNAAGYCSLDPKSSIRQSGK